MRSALAAAGTGVIALAASLARGAGDPPPILQWFEIPWADIEHRVPDLFLAGYGGVWLPPPSKTWTPGSPGYDVFDRFDLGRPGAPTLYGTEAGLRAAIAELHAADTLVYIDAVLNHNSNRQGSAAFQAAGGYPGFWMAPGSPPIDKTPTSPWGDFHAGNAQGYLQSTNPGGPNYDLLRGDLLGLIDLAHESGNQFIRHPVAPGNAQNLPPGTVRNRPDAANARLYPDQELPATVVHNPGTARNPQPSQAVIHPFNSLDPMAGDAVPEIASALLTRWTQWMLESLGADGFRLDAAKHAPSWYWDGPWDSVVHRRRVTPWGEAVTPLSFSETVDGNAYIWGTSVRKDAFGNRDALDLNGAGALRALAGAGGPGRWSDALGAHLDLADDGQNNGSLGVAHVLSHDNGSTGTGGAPPPVPSARQQALPQHAYLLARPGQVVVYHNARGVTRPGGFWPREGVPGALGVNPATGQADPTIARLAAIRSGHARTAPGFAVVNGTDPVNPSLDDVLIAERRASVPGAGPGATLLVGVSDRYDAGVQARNILTSFAPGTRLHELTGNAADPVVDPAGVVPELLIVAPDRRVLLTIPNNRSSAGEHGRGYVAYGPAAPAASIAILGASGAIPPDPVPVPAHRRRAAAVPIVISATFDLEVRTARADPLDPATDVDALFRIDQGFVDRNGNGIVDRGPADPVAPGYESFLTLHQPLYPANPPGGEGLYRQTIDGAALAEGYHYLSVLVQRHAEPGHPVIMTEAREVIYVDRTGPAIAWLNSSEPIASASHPFRIGFLDRTARRVHVLWDPPAGADPLALAGPANMGVAHDRFEWRRTLDGLTHGLHELVLVAFEDSGTATVQRHPGVYVDLCAADFNDDGVLNVLDVVAFQTAFALGDPRADFNGDGALNVLDIVAYQTALAVGCG